MGAARVRPRSELGARILVAVPAIAAAVLLVIVGGLVMAVAVLLVGALCLQELYSLYERLHPVRIAGLLALGGLLAAALYGHQAQVLLAAVAALPALFGLALLQARPSVAGIAVTLLGIYWIGFALAHAVLLRALPHGLGVLLDVLVGTFAGDSGAYLGGKLVGRTPLAPRISPSKTVEGLAIGMLFAVAGVWIAARFEPWMGTEHALLLGLGIALAAPVGDLFESFVKRDAEAKDSGTIFGAHGGALDRLDALLFTVVVGYYIWTAFL